MDYLDQNYVRLKDFGQNKKYKFRDNKTKDFILSENFEFVKSKSNTLIQKLIQNGYVFEEK